MSRYIDADALGIGKANRDVFENKAYADGWNAAIDIIESAPTADVAFGTLKEHFADVGKMVEPPLSKNGWIDAKIDKPKNGLARVLVCVDGVEIIGFPKIDTDRCIEGEWVHYGSHVTHWMPLPESPKGDKA